MAWNNNFTMQDLFMNSTLKGVMPQFGRREPVQQVYSFAEQTRQIKEFLRWLLPAMKSGDKLKVKGKQPEVLKQVKQVQTTIEQLFNSMPSISKNLRANTRVYMPFATISQMQDMSTTASKITALRAVIDNINFNPDFKSLNSITKDIPQMNFYQEQAKWLRKIGYKY